MPLDAGSAVRFNAAWTAGCDINELADSKEKQVPTEARAAGVGGMLSSRSVRSANGSWVGTATRVGGQVVWTLGE
ncbi:hypothetical protein GCM10011581_47460 [Saccharopolyspora subtropica]|uniref:Uncharacterized protein n=1 Tax=Saccharopolyspora thermophila TaxID=89367 RepID=A0A917KC11_9PSEU|nr:hypothetical protein GCM10011581_47460 [Saccharopolyspora subtropica]